MKNDICTYEEDQMDLGRGRRPRRIRPRQWTLHTHDNYEDDPHYYKQLAQEEGEADPKQIIIYRNLIEFSRGKELRQ